jgi:hypothetical protein
MNPSTDSWYVIDGETTPVPENDAGDRSQDRRAQFRMVLLGVGLVGCVLVAFLVMLGISVPATGAAAVVVAAPTPQLAMPAPLAAAAPASVSATVPTAPTRATPAKHQKRLVRHRHK